MMSRERHGAWMQTFTGRKFWPLDPRPDEVHIEDIAAALGRLCRYGGHCLRFYSVAEHCVHVAAAAPPEHRLVALMHDASEAYLADVIRPIKPFLSGYRDLEDKLMRVIAERFGFAWPEPAEVKYLDNAILSDERGQNIAHTDAPDSEWGNHFPPLGITLQFWAPEEATRRFLEAFAGITDPFQKRESA